jgi:hypothetical protein
MKCIAGIVLLVLLMSGVSFGQSSEQKSQRSKFSLGFLPGFTVLEKGEFYGYNSNGYGFNVNVTYRLIDEIKISGNLEVIFSKFKMEDVFDGRNKYEVVSKWYSIDIGPKFYINNGPSRIYFISNFKYTNIYHGEGNINIRTLENPDKAYGFNVGFGLEIRLNNRMNFEFSPMFNVLYPAVKEQFLNKVSRYYKISAGLNYNL